MKRTILADRFTCSAVAVTLGLGVTLPIWAQTTDHSAHKMSGTETAATLAYQSAMNTMMSSMAIPYTGNADVDFVRGMIPHHQGAIDNARIVLQYGTDPAVRKMAEGVISAQEAEILWLTDWLAKNGG